MVASTAAMLLITFNFFSSDFEKVSTQFADTRTVDLPDASFVTMNACSQLKIYKEDWDEERVIKLDGGAFFNVEKGNAFKVETDNGIVEVLGTSFNVYARGDQFKVYCATGKLRVNTEGQQETILLLGQSVILRNNQYKFWEKTPDNIAQDNWMKGEYVYNANALSDVIAEIQRQFDVKIEIDQQLLEKYYTGSFYSGNLENALMKVFWPLKLDYVIEGKRINITTK